MLVFWLVAWPWVGAALFALPRSWAKAAAAVVGAVEVLLFARLWALGQASVDWNWIPDLGVHFHLAVDGTSLVLAGLAAVVTLAAILASRREAGPAYYFWLLLALSSAAGVFFARDLVTFYVFWEVVLIPVFFLLTGWGGEGGRAAALRWLIMNLFGSFFLLVALIAVGVLHAEETGVVTFQLAQLAHTAYAPWAVPWIFLGFFVAFLIKAPLWPLHGWMPSAYGEAPAPVTAVLSGVLSKLGVYGMIRVLVPLFFPEMARWQPYLMALAAVGLVYGAAMALRLRDVKMVAAYASLSHLAMMSLGIFSLTRPGEVGAVFYMVAHGLMVGGLFLLLGWLEDRTGTRDLGALSGLNRQAPRLSGWFQLFALATLGLPGLPGFAGEYMIFQGLVVQNVTVAVVAGVVLVVASWYMIRLFQGAMQGPRRAVTLADLGVGQVAVIGVLGAVVTLLGVWPASVTGTVGHTSLPAAATAVRGGERG
ncbi:MAG: NADH-quinone oxidoreductase subunit M [Actinomycetia bacterium]|nr:NADH-quinone oxidoreductase subunit M [Actinomycetes bacterium]